MAFMRTPKALSEDKRGSNQDLKHDDGVYFAVVLPLQLLPVLRVDEYGQLAELVQAKVTTPIGVATWARDCGVALCDGA